MKELACVRARMARPAGGVQWGRALYRPPRLVRAQLGAPVPILFISDLHLRPDCPEMAQRALDPARGEQPALILLGGDMSEYDEGLVLSLEALRRVFPNTPAFAVPGNNDDGLFGGDRKAQREVYDRYGVGYLLNDSRSLVLDGRRVEIAGVEDSYTHTPCAEGLFSQREGVYRILLSHAPLSFLLDAGADLMLCGHTHGGQMNVLGFTCYFLGYESGYRYALLSGRRRFGKTLLLVSRGIGYSKLPVRIGSRSEIHLIT